MQSLSMQQKTLQILNICSEKQFKNKLKTKANQIYSSCCYIVQYTYIHIINNEIECHRGTI